MRLLFVSIGRETNLYGAGQTLLDLLGLLGKRNLEVIAVVSDEVASLIPPHIKTIVIPGRSHIIQSLKGFLHLLLISLEMRSEVIHFNFPPTSWQWLPLILLLKIRRSKIVYTFHGGILLEKKARNVQRRLFQICCRHIFHRIVVSSLYSKNVLVDFAILKSKLVEIPHGVVLSRFQVRTRGKLPGDPALLYVGRLEHAKGVDLLIDMMPRVLERFPKAQLHIVGSGSLKRKLVEQLAKLSLRNRVSFYGYISGNALSKFYSMADICVFPSRFETFGVSVLEAMASGKPIVATNVGNLPKLMQNGKNGVIVKCNPLALAGAVNVLFANEILRNDISSHNLETAKKYDWKEIVPKYVQLYHNLLKK